MTTGSAIDRALACPVSEVLPHVNRTNEFAEAGTSRHLYLSKVGTVGKEAALAMVPEEHREECAAIDLDGLPTNLATEVSFAWNWETGEARELGRDLGRDYSDIGPTEIAGTIDALGVSDDLVYVGDYKGFQAVNADGNSQLLFAAMCSTKVYDKDQAILEIINIRYGEPFRSKAAADVFDLAEFEARLAGTMKIIAGLKAGATIQPAVTEGPHCRYCPAYDSCPAKTAMIREMVAGAPRGMLPITPANAAEAYAKYKAMREMLSRVSDAIHAYAKDTPIPLEGGKVFGAREKQGNEVLDGDITYEVIRSEFGQEAADLAVTRKATKKGVESAVRAAKKAGTVTGPMKTAKDQIFDEVRARGGSERKVSMVVDEHRAELTS